MDQTDENQQPNVNFLNEKSSKISKMDQAHKGPPTSTNTFKFTSTSSSINSKLSNIAKIRQQLVEELKSLELPLKETKKNLKLKIAEVTKKANIVSEEMKKENALLCQQRELIDAKNEENKILREKIEELYECQKIIYENLEDVTATLNFNQSLASQLKNMFNSILIMQENDAKTLEEKLNNVTPDQKYIMQLNEINSKISEQEKELEQNMNEINELELKIKAAKVQFEEEKKISAQLDQKIAELEKRNETMKREGLKQKQDLLEEVEKLKQEVDADKIEIQESDIKIVELKSKLEKKRNEEKELEKICQELNKDIDLLIKEKEELAKQKCNIDQQNQIVLKEREEQLQIAQNEFNAVEQQQNQATDILQKKIFEMNNKLKSFDGIESKLKKIEMEIQEGEDSLKKIVKEGELKKKTLSDEIKLENEKLNGVKTEISKIEHRIAEDEETIKTLEKEILELDGKIEKKLQEAEKNKIELSDNLSKYKLPEFKDLGSSENKTRRQLYTPPVSDDMDIDSLPIDEQIVQLTQSKSCSPDKKFFKYSQSRSKSTPRKGRSKNN